MQFTNSAPTMVLLAGASLFAAAPAAAGLSDSFSLTRTAEGIAADTLHLDKFDSDLGTLNSVTFTLSDDQAAIHAKVVLGFEGTTGTAAASASFSLAGPGGSLYSGNGSAAATCTGAFTCTGLSSDPGGSEVLPSFFTSLFFNAALSPYQASGGGDLALDVTLNLIDVDGTCIKPNPGANTNCTYSGEASWQGTVTVSYDFTRADPGTDVAEPETLALLGLSLLGLVAVSRRSQGEHRR